MGKLEEYLASQSDKANADVPEGATCWICLCGSNDDDEPLLRGCACRGDAGYAHVSCLADSAEKKSKTLYASRTPSSPKPVVDETNSWSECGLCLQSFTGTLGRRMAFLHYERSKKSSDIDDKRLAMQQLSTIYMQDSESEKALSLLRRLRQMDEKLAKVAEERGFTSVYQGLLECCADVSNQIGVCLMKLGKGAEALEAYEEGLAALDKGKPELSRDSVEGTAIVNNIAQIHIGLGEYGEARALLRKVVDIRGRARGKNTAEYITSINSLVCALVPLSQFEDEAISLLRENVQRSKRLLGPEHPLTMKCVYFLARIDSSVTDEHAADFSNTFATVEGVKSRPDLNGKRVAILRLLDCRTRYECRLCKSNEGGNDPKATFGLKLSNLIIENGTKGIIHDLVSASHLNGKKCKILSYDRERKRHVVELLYDKETKFRVRPENIYALLS